MARDTTVRNIHININGKEVVNSFAGISKAIRETHRDIANLNKNDADYNEQLAKHQARLVELRGRYSQFRDEMKGTSETMKKSSKEIENSNFSILNFFNAIKSGDVQGLTDEFQNLSGGIANVAKSSLAFAATPIGAIITSLTGIVVATNYWLDYNNEMQRSTRILQQITGLTGEALEDVTARTRAFADYAEEDLKTVAASVNAVAKAYNIDYVEALKMVERGYVRGGEVAEDFFDNTSEYISQFKNAGYSAEEFFSILEQGVKNGTYKDKIVDAIKEMDLRLKEFSNSTRESLENAFGETFTNNLAQGISSGAITTKSAIQMINEEADRVGLNFQQKQQVVADVFGSMGEDAGGFNAVLDTINDGLNNTYRELTDIEQAQLDVIKASEDLEVALAQLFNVSGGGFEVMKADLQVIVLNWLTSLVQRINALITLSKIVILTWYTFKDSIAEAAKALFGLGDVWERVLDFDLKGAKDALKRNFSEASDIVKDGRKKIVAIINSQNAELLQSFYATPDNENSTSGGENTGTNNNKNKGSGGNDKRAEREAERLRKQKEREQEIWDKGEKEIDAILKRSQEQRELMHLNALQREEAQINSRFAKEIEKYSEHTDRIVELEAARDAEIQAVRERYQAESLARAEEIEQQNLLTKAELEAELEAENITKFEERSLFMLDRMHQIAMMELDIEREKQLQKLEIAGATAEEIAALEERFALQKQKMQQDHDRAEKQLRTQQVDWTKLTENQKLDAIKGAFNGAAEAFNEGSGAWKAAKIGETTIATYQSATNAYNSLAGIPIVGPALGAAAAALAVVTGLKNVQKISNTPLNKMPTHYFGGPTGSEGIGMSDGYGAITGMVHANEWVSPAFMTQSPRYAPIINWLENERQMQLSGVAGSSSNPFFDHPVFQALAIGVNHLTDTLSNGIVAHTYYGYEDVEKMENIKKEVEQSKSNAKIST